MSALDPMSHQQPPFLPWQRLVFLVLCGSTTVVPLVVARWRVDPFALPKLAVLWSALVVCVLALTVGVLVGGSDFVRMQVHRSVDIPLAAFVVLSILATVFSIDPAHSMIGERRQFQGLLTLLLYVAFFIVARLIVSTARQLRFLFLASTAGALLVALYGFLQHHGIDPVWDVHQSVERAFASIGQPNALAAYLIVVIPATIVLSREAKTIPAAAVLAATGIMVSTVFLTGSRGGYLGLGVSVAFVLLTWRGWNPAWGARIVAGGLLIVLALALLIQLTPGGSRESFYWRRFTSIAEFSNDASAKIHLDLYLVSSRVAIENPILGTGPETFPDVFSEYSHKTLTSERAAYLDFFRVESPHNLLLAIAAGSGLPSLVAFLSFLWGVSLVLAGAGRADPSKAPYLRAVLASLIGYLISNSFITQELVGTWIMWVLLGAGIGASCHRSEQRDVVAESK